MMKKTLLMTLVAFMAHVPVSAVEPSAVEPAFETGKAFLTRSSAEQTRYVMGVVDAVATMKNTSILKRNLFCAPPNVSLVHVTDIARKFVSENATSPRESASGLELIS